MHVAGLFDNLTCPRRAAFGAGWYGIAPLDLLDMAMGRGLVSRAKIAICLTFFGFTLGAGTVGGATARTEGTFSSVLLRGVRA